MKRPCVIVAMSGGVDSAVAAGLLARQGYEVIGVTMRLWTLNDTDAPRHRRHCCSVEYTDDAREAAQALGIPHYVLNLELQFQESVVDYFCHEYQRGRTPNPCLACNEHVKFNALLSRAVALEADFLATGHYARVDHVNGRYRLLRAVDGEKDQSYVLMLGQAQLTPAVPDRHHRKAGCAAWPPMSPAGRRSPAPTSASSRTTTTAGSSPAGWGRRQATSATARRIVGRHQGVAAFTVGQRRGLGVAMGEKRFVTAIDPARNLVTIGPEEELLADELWAEDVRWVSGGAPPAGAAVEAKIRYRTPAAPAELYPQGEGARVLFRNPQRATTPGQAVVFYQGEEVVGGGIIAGSGRSDGTRGDGRRP
jgi:tRNA-specific 2-thiouridylase